MLNLKLGVTPMLLGTGWGSVEARVNVHVTSIHNGIGIQVRVKGSKKLEAEQDLC